MDGAQASLVTALAIKMREHNVLPEIEIFDLSHLYGAKRLVEAGLIIGRKAAAKLSART